MPNQLYDYLKRLADESHIFGLDSNQSREVRTIHKVYESDFKLLMELVWELENNVCNDIQNCDELDDVAKRAAVKIFLKACGYKDIDIKELLAMQNMPKTMES